MLTGCLLLLGSAVRPEQGRNRAKPHSDYRPQMSPVDYLVEVLQCVGQQPASLLHELTPRHWKERFAANLLRSDLRDNLISTSNSAG